MGAAAQQDQPWSATIGHSVHTLGNPVLVLCAISAWSVALVLLIGLVVSGTDKLGLAIGFIGLAALGVLPAAIVQTPQETGPGLGGASPKPGRGHRHHGHRPDPGGADRL